jgi:hypothetical protein
MKREYLRISTINHCHLIRDAGFPRDRNESHSPQPLNSLHPDPRQKKAEIRIPDRIRGGPGQQESRIGGRRSRRLGILVVDGPD